MQPRFRTCFARLGAAALAFGALVSCVESAPQQPYATTPGTSAAGAPASQPMQEPRALGLWKSNFGAVKIEEDLKTGTPGGGVLHGVWMYTRNGADVVGYFSGRLDGNVFQFTWQEPSQPAPLVGSGYLVFDPQGQRFKGKWWTDAKDRVGEWSGWRQGVDKPRFQNDPYGQPQYGQPPPADPDGAYGGQGYGDPYDGRGNPPPPPPTRY